MPKDITKRLNASSRFLWVGAFVLLLGSVVSGVQDTNIFINNWATFNTTGELQFWGAATIASTTLVRLSGLEREDQRKILLSPHCGFCLHHSPELKTFKSL